MSRDDPFHLVGAVIDGRYRVDALVGEGGLGVVYRGFHLSFEKPVALKVLKLPGKWTPQQRVDYENLFRTEGKALRALADAHSAFVQIWDMGVMELPTQAAPYLVMEWLEGQPLQRHLERRKSARFAGAPLAEVIAQLDPVARALAVAHAMTPPIAHEDIKPANIFLAKTPQGMTVKILDFGIASAMAEAASARNAATRDLVDRAFQYAVPEQCDERYGKPGPWTDVYALALVAVEMLSDKFALAGESLEDLIGATLNDRRRPTPRAMGVPVSDMVEMVFDRALSVRAKNRFKDAAAFWSALCDAAGIAMEGGADAMRAGGGSIRRAASQPGTAELVARPVLLPAKRRGFGPGASALALLAALGGVAAAAWFLLPELRPSFAGGGADAVPSGSAHTVTAVVAGSGTASTDTSAPPVGSASPSASGSAKAAPSASVPPKPKGKFDRVMAMAALATSTDALRTCRQSGPPVRGSVRVTFAPSGSVIAIYLDGPFEGTTVGGCVAGVLKDLKMAPFDGPAATLTKSILLD